MGNGAAEIQESIRQYLAEKCEEKLQLLRKKRLGDQVVVSDEEIEIRERFQPANWLTDAARRAKQIKFFTHNAKFIHSDAKASARSVLPDENARGQLEKRGYVCTSTLINPRIDAGGNAAALDVANFLLLSSENKAVISYVIENDSSPFMGFEQSPGQLEEWMAGFRTAVDDVEPTSHYLAKQIYFPIAERDTYHLLSPLPSSSLIEELSGKVSDARFSDAAKAAREAKRKNLEISDRVTDFVHLAWISFGGANAQNISLRNAKRKGAHLLTCAPPYWKRQQKPPLKTTSIFSRHHLDRIVGRTIKELQAFLKQVRNSPSTAAIREKRSDYIDDVIDLVLAYAAEIQNLPHPGWSAAVDCELDMSEQLWLDPGRCHSDSDFFKARTDNDWQGKIAEKFGFWLNKRLEGDHLSFGDAEQKEWKSILHKKLRALKFFIAE